MFNTLLYAKKLEAVGVLREQAEAHVQIIADIVEEQLATKQDVEKVRNDLVMLEYRLVIKLGTIATLSIAALAAIMKFF